MKKKIWIPILAVVVLAVLFAPLPTASYDDGGTREYIALTYKIVDWNKIQDDGAYHKTRFYFGSDRNKTIDELWQTEKINVEEKFTATVVEINENTVTVEPLEDQKESQSGKITFGISDLEKIEAVLGSLVEVTYKGGIMETYPAQIVATKWDIAGYLPNVEYTEEWLDKTTAEKYDNNLFDHITITRIYANCFFAKTVIPMPSEIKLNGSISEGWCVGDQVSCTYENTYYDAENNRIEADMLTIEASDWQPDPYACYKPVIYLYPEKETKVSVELELDGKLTCTYPLYNGGWQVTAQPDGTLADESGKIYNYLYWEGETNARYDLSQGFCIKGEDTAAFLENALEKLGLNRREANEFIVYWLPLMEQNPYNIISFETENYINAAELKVEPTPDTVIRVFMAWQKADEFIELDEQHLTAPERNGFTVVEWGGTKIK